jgi:succinyl-CoA synthetase alpha subunit
LPRIVNVVKRGLYRDSVQLLHISEKVRGFKGVLNALMVMGTRLNKEILAREGLLTPEGEGAGENDLVIALSIDDQAVLGEILRRIDETLSNPPPQDLDVYSDLDHALDINRDINLALVSVPGQYAREIVLKLLDRGLHVHLFSDHVPIEHEIELKRYAVEKGLLLMGPEAGTSIIGGAAIAFANSVRKGPIGIVSASGTGLQEVSVLLHRVGLGISHGIGVGGRDLSKEVGGIMTLFSIAVLERDIDTRVITIISKPPSQEVVRMVMDRISSGEKDYITCFVGGDTADLGGLMKRVSQARTLHAAVLEAVRRADPGLYSYAHKTLWIDGDLLTMLSNIASELREGQRYVRGLFTGGTLASEAMLVLSQYLGAVYSNSPLREDYRLPDPWRSVENTVVDLGGEEFTEGRPHPMIDPSIRVKMIIEEARDPEVGVIMLDFVLGYGAHPDPVGAHVEAIRKAMEIARSSGRRLAILAHVVGTDEDPQVASSQEDMLRRLGAIVLPTNAIMALSAAMIASRRVDSYMLSDFHGKFIRGVCPDGRKC